MDKKIKLPEIVMLIDAAFLNYVVSDLKSYFEKMLNRPLREIDLSLSTTYLALDAGISEGDNKVQLLFVYDKDSSKLLFCKPADLKEELNGVAFSSQFGEFSFAGVPCEEMVTREELFLDLLEIVSDSADVKKLTVISFNEEYGDKVRIALNAVKEKEVIQFRMSEPDGVVEYHWEMLAFPLMQALGIKGDEL